MMVITVMVVPVLVPIVVGRYREEVPGRRYQEVRTGTGTGTWKIIQRHQQGDDLSRLGRTTGGAAACSTASSRHRENRKKSLLSIVSGDRHWNRLFRSCFPTHPPCFGQLELAFQLHCRTADLDSLDSNYVAFQGVDFLESRLRGTPGDLLHTTTHQSTWLGGPTEGGTSERRRLAIYLQRYRYQCKTSHWHSVNYWHSETTASSDRQFGRTNPPLPRKQHIARKLLTQRLHCSDWILLLVWSSHWITS